MQVALTWDGRNLLIPSLLPDEYHLRAGYPDSEVTVRSDNECKEEKPCFCSSN